MVTKSIVHEWAFWEYIRNHTWKEMTNLLLLWLVWQDPGGRQLSPSDGSMLLQDVRNLPAKNES
jgi:hypothetical protein